jgi:hypothetical protein
MLDAIESFFFNCRDDLSVANDRSCGVAVIRVDTENVE